MSVQTSVYINLNSSDDIFCQCNSDAREIQTPVHIKPQLVRSASKVRTPRAPELELDMSSLNNRPAPLAPVGQSKTVVSCL